MHWHFGHLLDPLPRLLIMFFYILTWLLVVGGTCLSCGLNRLIFLLLGFRSLMCFSTHLSKHKTELVLGNLNIELKISAGYDSPNDSGSHPILQDSSIELWGDIDSRKTLSYHKLMKINVFFHDTFLCIYKQFIVHGLFLWLENILS